MAAPETPKNVVLDLTMYDANATELRCKGFIDGAIAIFTRLRDTNEGNEYSFIAGVYCLRHGVELLIKQLSVYVAYEMLDKSLLYVPGHRLEPIWKKIGEHADDMAEGTRDSIEVLVSMVDEFSESDPGGTTMRYGEDVRFDKKTMERTRAPTKLPWDTVNILDWCAMADATLEAANNLLYDFAQRCSYLRHSRGHEGLDLTALTEEHHFDWSKITPEEIAEMNQRVRDAKD